MSGMNKQPLELWLEVLKGEVAKSNIADVARQLGYSRTTVSLILSGKYVGGTRNFAAAVIRAFTDYVQCPFLGQDIVQAKCTDHQSRSMPTSDPNALRHWIACRGGCVNGFCGTEKELEYA